MKYVGLTGYQEKYLKAQKEVEKLGDIQKVLESKILGHDILREEIQLEKEKNKMLENQLQSRERSDIHKEELEEELSSINAKLKDTIEALGQANKMNDTLENKVSTLSDEKNTSLVRNAELSQQTSLCQQQLLRREEELKDHIEKSNAIQEENKQFNFKSWTPRLNEASEPTSLSNIFNSSILLYYAVGPSFTTFLVIKSNWRSTF